MRYLEEREANQVKRLLLNAKLLRPIVLHFPEINLCFNIGRVSNRLADHDYDQMETRIFRTPDGDESSFLGNRLGDLHLNVGRWSNRARIDASHLVPNCRLFDERFCQMELSTCLSDGETIYLVKNLSNSGGEGAIVRLNAGAANKEELRLRREQLRRDLGNGTLWHEDKEYIVVAAIPIRRITREADELFQEIITDILRYAGRVECLRETGSSVPAEDREGFHRMSLADRLAVEQAGMRYAREWLERRGYLVEDVSSRRCGYDLLAERSDSQCFVEVKGTTVEKWAVEMTANEVKVAESQGALFLLLVVVLDSVEQLNLKRVNAVGNPTMSDQCVIVPTGYLVQPSNLSN